METIKLDKAFHLAILKNHSSSLITHADLYAILKSLYIEKTFEGKRIGKIKNDEPELVTFNAKVKALVQNGIITQFADTKAFCISGRGEPSAEVAGCYLYPYSYLCYLSAMEFHGLTDRLPKSVHLMIPNSSQRSSLGLNVEDKQTFNGDEDLLIKSVNIKISTKVEGKSFIYHTNKNFRIYNEIIGSGGLRVSPIGRTFLDMLQNPTSCGGFRHVVDVLENNASRYLKLILKEFDEYGTNIDRSRLGFILESLMNISDPILDEWVGQVQRGSSRVLFAGQPYSPYFSERWCISINIKDLEEYGARSS